MSAFTEAEIAYFATQRLGRLATVGKDGAPHVVPVGFRYNAETDTIDIGGHRMSRSKKWRDIGRDPRVAFVVDDVLPPWRPRLVEIRGVAARLEAGGKAIVATFGEELIRISPSRIVSWGVNVDDQNAELRVGGRDVGGSSTGSIPASTDASA